jgi:hypothetical protein
VYACYWLGSLREVDCLECPGLHESIIFKWNFRKWIGGIDYIEVDKDRSRRMEIVYAGIKFWDT